jgi:hypothetical protein
MTDLRGAEGCIIEADCRIFYRAGPDGTHHIEEGVQFILDESPPERLHRDEAILLLTQAERERLADSHAHRLDGLTVPADDPTAHRILVEVEVHD